MKPNFSNIISGYKTIMFCILLVEVNEKNLILFTGAKTLLPNIYESCISRDREMIQFLSPFYLSLFTSVFLQAYEFVRETESASKLQILNLETSFF